MKKIYQRIDDPRHGDCFKCAIASLLDLEYEEVPHFIEMGDNWVVETQNFFAKHGYNWTGRMLYNPRMVFLENPTWNLYENLWPFEECTFSAIKPEYGINGLFLAGVYSPKYTTPSEHPVSHLHSVLCDIDFNIVFDPNPEYEKVVNYPYSRLIDYNGIRTIDIIKKL
jgi:hypothetical protein